MAETDAERDKREKERQDRSPLTGVLSLHDLLRHLISHGPARNDAERAELTAAVDRDDPDVDVEEDPGMTAEEKAAEYDRIQAQARPAGGLSDAEKAREYDRLREEHPPTPATRSQYEQDDARPERAPEPGPALTGSGWETPAAPPAPPAQHDPTGGNA